VLGFGFLAYLGGYNHGKIYWDRHLMRQHDDAEKKVELVADK
jgi:hypothetical protein